MKKIGTTTGTAQPIGSRSLAPDKRREALLYVEDDDDNWYVARLRLADRYDMCRATTAQEACKVLSERGREFVAILMDIELQGSELNGIQLTELIRGRAQRDTLPSYAASVPVLDIPVIFVTAHGQEFSEARFGRAGGDRVIDKPVDFNALNLAITQTHLERVLSKRRAART